MHVKTGREPCDGVPLNLLSGKRSYLIWLSLKVARSLDDIQQTEDP